MINLTRGAARGRIDRDDALRLIDARTLIIDDRRRRPFYFDGRFLTARDLTREQEYFLARQADFGRTTGAGVVVGLNVSVPQSSSNSIRINPGHGITPAGEIVVLTDPLPVNFLDVPETLRLDAAFGLSQVPGQAARTRDGLYVLALRPVEFTANPIAQYPRTLTENRSAQDGEIIEATALTLIPYPDDGMREERAGRRARIAREIFLQKSVKTLPANALPLAMVALNGGVLEWIDTHMVRREVGADHGDLLGLNFAPRALREAHFQQYLDHLEDVLEARNRANRGERFTASEHFQILPPAGPMPLAALNTSNFTQVFFPPSVDVELAIIPDDELPAIIEESLLLPPLDLSMSVAEQESTSVLILVPLSRTRIAQVLAAGAPPPIEQPPVPALIAGRKPLQSLLRFQLDRGFMGITRKPVTVEARWRQVITEVPQLWFARRRNIPFKQEIIGAAGPVIANDLVEERALMERLSDAGLDERFVNRKKTMTTRAAAEMAATLAAPKFASSPALLSAALKMFEDTPEPDHTAAYTVARRLSEPKLGEGVARLEASDPELGKRLADSPYIVEIDRIGRLAKEEELPTISAEISKAIEKGQASIETFAMKKLEELDR